MKYNKIILAGKASLAAVMATSLVTPATAFAAEEPAPVIEEKTETQELLNDEPVIVEEENNVQLFASSLPQYPSTAPGYRGKTVDQLKEELTREIPIVENTWTTNGGEEYYKANRVDFVLEYIAEAKQYLADGQSDAPTFSWQCYQIQSAKKALNNKYNIHTPNSKEIYRLNAEKATLVESEYTPESWKTYSDAVRNAMDTADASGSSITEARLQEEIDKVNAAKTGLKKLDQNLVALNALVKECEDIVSNRKDNGCTRHAWNAFTSAYNEAASKLKESDTLTPEESKALLDKLSAAKAGLVTVTPDGQEAGIRDEWKDTSYQSGNHRYGGKLYVSGFRKTAEGTEVDVTFINDGLDPSTGKKFKNYRGTDFAFGGKETLRKLHSGLFWQGDFFLDVEVNNGTEERTSIRVNDLANQTYVDGFTKTVVFPKEVNVKTIDLLIAQVGNRVDIPSLGTYYAPIPAPTATVTYSDTNPVRKPITATITSDVPLDEIPEGWTKVSDTVIEKVYEENCFEEVIIKGNGKTTRVNVSIRNHVNPERLIETIEKAESLNPANYAEDAYWYELEDSLKAAKEILADPMSDQDTMDGITNRLTNAMEYLHKIDKKALKAAIEAAEALNSDEYLHDASWDAFTEALRTAQDVLEDKRVIQQRIDYVKEELINAQKELTKVDKTELEAAIKEAETLKPEDYAKDENWNKFQEALKNAKEVFGKNIYSQDEVDAAVSGLKDAQKGIHKVSKKELEEAIKGAETVKPEDYVKDENWNKFQEALKKAEEVLADETATQDEVDAAIKALNEAKANLKKAEDKKEEDKKDTNTAVGLNAGLFATLMGSSALGAAVLESLKRKNRK